jgi:hypothetical protein
MVVAAVAMFVRAFVLLRGGDSQGVVLLAFGTIGGAFAAGNL